MMYLGRHGIGWQVCEEDAGQGAVRSSPEKRRLTHRTVGKLKTCLDFQLPRSSPNG